MNYCVEDCFVNKDFVSVVRSILSFVDKQRHQKTFKYKDTKQRNVKIYLENRDWLYDKADPDCPERFCGRRKSDFLDSLKTMIACIETPKIRKSVTDYYDAMMTSYCYSLREKMRLERETKEKIAAQEFQKGFLPKPFVIISYPSESNKVYLPPREVWTNENGDRMCACVHMCDKFQTYPVLAWGIKQIHPHSRCKYVDGWCDGCRIFKNGEIIDAHVQIKNCIFNGLKPQKTKQR